MGYNYDQVSLLHPDLVSSNLTFHLLYRARCGLSAISFRDNVTGYALVLLQNPDRQMPANCIKYDELVDILNEFGRKDRETKERAVATKARR